LDADGRRAIQYVITRSLARTLTFELYSLSLEQFLDRYASGFRGSAGWEFNPISTEGTELAYSWEVEPEDLPNEYNSVREVIIPDNVPSGLYLLNVKAGRLDDQLILMLTSNTLTVKQAEGQIMAWVTDINGSPVPGIEVGVYARDGQLLVSDTADSRGVFRGQIPDFEVGGPAAIEPLVVVAQNGSDITASGLTYEWQAYTGNSWYWWQPGLTNPEYAAYVYTDRPIYRPGHIVFFKAIVRTDQDAVLDVPPAGTPATVRIRDARNNVVQTLEMTTNDFGSLDGSFQLAEGAMLGEYRIDVSLDDEVHSQIFKVEDYRKPDYQVSISTDAEQYLDGDTVTIVVDTEYYFGEPVPNAEVSIARFYADPYYSDYYGSSSVSWSQPYNQQPITGRTNDDGIFTTTVQTEVGSSYYQNSWGSNLTTSTWGFEATVDDGSHQSVSGFTAIKVFDRAEYLTVSTGSYVQPPGTPFNIVATVYDIFGDPVDGRRLSIEFRRWDRSSHGYDIVVQSDAVTTGEDGRGILPFTIEEAGYYQLRVFGTDQDGKAISFQSWIYAYSDLYSSWYGQDSNLTVTADKESYAPGDTANLLIESTFSGPALLTFERGTTRREMLVELTAPVTMIEVPIETTDVPNIHVIVNAWQEADTTLQPEMYESVPDSNLRTANINLSVPATHKILNVTITPDQEVYAPREEATFTIEVTNYRGEPVSAEVSLAMVDEAIFALSEELSGPIYDAFYYERSNIVRTFNSLAITRYLYGGGKGGGGGDGFVAGNPRSDFQDTAAWFPTLYTDANGRVQVTITLPDNLTSWRLTAKAATADTQIGETITNVLTQQPIIIRPLLPRTLTAGDSVGLSAVVHNYSESTQAIQVSVREAGDSFLSFEDTLTQTITLPPGSLQIVGWTAEAEEAGSVTLIFAAAPISSTVAGDAVQLPLTIRPLAIPDVTTQVGQFDTQLATSVTMPAGALPMSQVEIQLSRTIAGSLLEGLDYLTGFPYGCVEQTMSRALPNAVVGRAMNQLGVSDPALQADLPAKINASIQRLYGYQHNDGGWGWWFDDDTHDYQTAWVIFGLGTTAEAGYEIDPDVITRGVAWMNENLSAMDIRTRAFALYSMAVAGQPNAEATLTLYERVDELDTFSQAALALALHRLGELAEAREIIDLLAETAVNQSGFVHWDGSDQDGAYYSKTMASEVRSTALALSAFSVIEPGHQLEGGMVRWLMNQRRQQGWGTTNETSFAILGLTDHLLATSFSDAATETEYTVSLNGEVIASGSLGRGEPAISLIIPQEQLQSGENNLVINKSGSGQLYYVINTTAYLEQAEVEAAGEIGIERLYLDPETNKSLTSFEAGQLVLVRLRIWMPEDGSYMIVEDSLPAGLEALNERLNTTTFAADPNSFQENPSYWRSYGYNYKEVFGDRVSFFITEMDDGWHTITYMARATRPGTFTAMPVESYAMYNLALWGRSASHMITVTEFEN
jgi:hypothetical protein